MTVAPVPGDSVTGLERASLKASLSVAECLKSIDGMGIDLMKLSFGKGIEIVQDVVKHINFLLSE
jgi:hypothetical protein